MLTDAAPVEKVLAGKQELSAGYLADLEEAPGRYRGEPYPHIQRHIVGNHVAAPIPRATPGSARGHQRVRAGVDRGIRRYVSARAGPRARPAGERRAERGPYEREAQFAVEAPRQGTGGPG